MTAPPPYLADVTGRTCVEFVGLLRVRGLPPGPEQTVAFYEALHLMAAAPGSSLGLRQIYWAGRAVLVGQRQHGTVYDRAFADFFGELPGDERDVPPQPRAVPMSAVERDDAASGTPTPWAADAEDEQADDARLVPGEVHLLKEKSFGAMTPQERRRAAALIRRLRPELPRRRSRRRRPAVAGRYLHVRGVLRESLPTDGEAMRLPWRRQRFRERPLTLVIDVSGSMTPYAKALLRFGHTLKRAGHRVEVFTCGMHLTRVTDSLRKVSVDTALRHIGEVVDDWDGGTLLGTSMRELVDRYGGHSSLRGALLVVCSDGLDRDDPATLGEAMCALSRRAHRVVWLNPLKGDPRYRPLARGMAAALPYIDVFLPGHNLASLEDLCRTISARRVVQRKAKTPAPLG
ncbi:VWA domain-containing protein [Streptomyces sp. NPDC051677]|uniref:VWA domain-containing protein n=1 Tax=Streptomyces sp. NPDC051677 TaxID=3365669 RepID=UPI0037CF31FD